MINETLGLYLPDCVLDFTEHKRVIVVGGKYSNEPTRVHAQKVFGFKDLIWESCEDGNLKVYARMAERVRSGHYDAVFVLLKGAGHQADYHIKPTAKSLGIPYIMINGAWNLNNFSHAIEEQVCRKLAPTSQHAKSSSQVLASAHGGRPVNY